MTDQLADRCPGCAAIVRPGSPWCTLCFTDLRPVTAQPDADPAPRSMAGSDPLAASLAVLERGDGAADEATTAAPEGIGWPCLRCGEKVGIELDACPACGAGFMQVGGNGDLLGLGRFGSNPPDKKTQFSIMVGGAGLICLGILAILFVLGSIF